MKRLLFWLLSPALLSALVYDVNFVGLTDQEALKSMFDVSDLVVLQERPPASVNALRYRAAGDIPALIRVLHAYGYYDASITAQVTAEYDKAQVYLYIDAGPRYRLSSYKVYEGDCTVLATLPGCMPFSPENLGLTLGKPILSSQIVQAELDLLNRLARCGYPLAKVHKRRVEVDMASKEIDAASCIDQGPLSKYGPTVIFGLKEVEPRYIERRIVWKEGQSYNTETLEETQKRLLNTDLFSSVLISHAEELDSEGKLPMQIRLTEAKHRQFTIGGFYATVDGPGAIFSWTNRNLRGMGEVFTLEGDVSKRFMSGTMTYKKPDFLTANQSYRAVGEMAVEDIRAYTAFTYRGANYIDRYFPESKNFFSVGFKVDHTTVTESATNGSYLLAGLPLMLKTDQSDDLLDPSKGYTLVYQCIPYQSCYHAHQHFFHNQITGTTYIPLAPKKILTLALRLQVGSIAGAKRMYVPLPKLFLGGSEDDLRGYRYHTVSPLNDNNQPLGGRSAIYTSVETRFKFNKWVGLVPFADFGTVTSGEMPTVNAQWFKSIGIGLRIFTFFGPLRFDVGFPLDRRAGIDPSFRIYAGIGQAF